EGSQRFLGRLPTARLEEVDRGDLGEPLLQASQTAEWFRAWRTAETSPLYIGVDFTNLGGEFRIVVRPLFVEPAYELLVRQAIDEVGLAHIGIAAGGPRLHGDTGQAGERGGAARQDVNGILEGEGANPRQSPTHPGAEVDRPGG